MVVSVIIPVRNGAKFIAEAVNSALDQSDVRRVVVIDDGSSDATVEIVRGLSDPRISLTSLAGSGVSAARNTGFRIAEALDPLVGGEAGWTLFLDADDRLTRGAVGALLSAVQADCAAVYGDYERIDEAGNLIGRRTWLRGRRKPSGEILERLAAGNFIVNGGILLIRREAFRASGGFDESLSHCEDWHLFCRIAAVGPVLWKPEAVTLHYRVHGASAMMQSGLRYRQYQLAAQRVFSDPLIVAKLPQTRRAALKRTAEAHLRAYLACQTLRSGAWRRALSEGLSALAAMPSRAPRTMLQLIGAAAGM